MKISVYLFLVYLLTLRCYSDISSHSEPQNIHRRDLPERLEVKLNGKGDQTLVLNYMDSGTVGMVYRIEGSNPPQVIKIPFAEQGTLFDAEVNMLTDPIVKGNLGDLLVDTQVDFIKEINQQPSNLKVLIKEEVIGEPIRNLDINPFQDSLSNLFNRLKELALEETLILEDLHDENILITNQEPRRIKIIDGTLRRSSSRDYAKTQFVDSCNDWSWCRKFALDQVRTTTPAQRCRRLSELFSLYD